MKRHTYQKSICIPGKELSQFVKKRMNWTKKRIHNSQKEKTKDIKA